MPTLLITALLLPFFCCFFFPLIEKFRGLISALIALISFLLIGAVWYGLETDTAALFSLPFVPSLGVNFSFLVDGLSLFFGLLVTGVGALVSFYAHYYMDPQDPYLGRFYAYLNFFMSAMLSCVFADNLLLMFLFWELTGVASYLLISYSFEKAQTVISARLVFLVTSLTSLALLVGVILIALLDQTFLWSDIVSQGIATGKHPYWQYAIILCFLVGIFGKSAQVPFHFWLPNAMCAPTPVSAYLHAATMVKLGIYLTARMYPLFVVSPIWFPTVTTFCFATMLIGAILSLLSNDLKQILAYATVSQLGFFIGFYGMGNAEGVSYDFIHILNHAFYKGSLFMLVGIIDHATGIRDIRYLGGLWKKLPLTTLIFFIAAAAMAGVPGTTGFLSKELILSDLVMIGRTNHSGVAILLVLIGASIFKVAFSIRLFYHLFVREHPEKQHELHRPAWQTLVSPAILSLLAFGFGLWPAGLQNLADSFYVSGLHAADPKLIKLWHGWTIEVLISGAIFGIGTALFLAAEKTQLWWVQHPLPDFAHLWNRAMDKMVASSKKLTEKLTGNSPSRHLGVLLIAFALAVGLPLYLDPHFIWSPFSSIFEDILRFFVMLLITGATLPALFLKDSISRVISIAASGFFVTLYFVIFKAPDLAMTQLLVEVVTGMMLLIMVWAVKGESFDRARKIPRALAALLVGLCTMTLPLTFADSGVAKPLKEYFLEGSLPLAHGANAVNTILVDFRGLDTLGEVTVLLIATLAIVGLARPHWQGHIALIPSVILKTVTPYLFMIVNVFALYLLLRGHNQPGGGFIAGLACAIAFILLGMTVQLKVIRKMLAMKLLLLPLSGFALVLGVSIFPLLGGYPFLKHFHAALPTTLLFDAGVFLIVLGIAMIGIFALRADALAAEVSDE